MLPKLVAVKARRSTTVATRVFIRPELRLHRFMIQVGSWVRSKRMEYPRFVMRMVDPLSSSNTQKEVSGAAPLEATKE